MENLKTVSALVKNILEHDHKARNTDNHLYLMVLEHYSGLRGIDIHAMTVPVFLKELDRRSFPGFHWYCAPTLTGIKDSYRHISFPVYWFNQPATA